MLFGNAYLCSWVGDADEEEQTRIVPSWKLAAANAVEGVDGEATILQVSMGDGVYESMNYDPQIAHHAQSLRKMDHAMSVAASTCSSWRAGEQDEGLGVNQHANKGQAQRRIPKDRDDESPPLDENSPPLENGAGPSLEVGEESQEIRGSIPMASRAQPGGQQAAKEVAPTEPPRWSSYFSKGRACEEEDNSHKRRGLVNDANMLLQQMQEHDDRDCHREAERRHRRKR